jgi:hypothetical protein
MSNAVALSSFIAAMRLSALCRHHAAIRRQHRQQFGGHFLSFQLPGAGARDNQQGACRRQQGLQSAAETLPQPPFDPVTHNGVADLAGNRQAEPRRVRPRQPGQINYEMPGLKPVSGAANPHEVGTAPQTMLFAKTSVRLAV